MFLTRLHPGMAVAAPDPCALSRRKDEQDVGFTGLGGVYRGQRCQQQSRE